MKCTKCNHEYDDSLAACPLCGEPAVHQTQSTPGSAAPAHEFPPVRPPAEVPPAEPVPDSSGAAPLVLGILSLFIPFVGVVLAIIAIVMGGGQRRTYPPGTAHNALGHAGWVLGIVGLVLQALLIIWFFTVIGFALNVAHDAIRYSAAPFGYNSYDLF